MEYNASDNDHDEHQKHCKKATPDELHAVLDKLPAVKLRGRGPRGIATDVLGHGEDVRVSRTIGPIHRTAETLRISDCFIGVFGREYLPDQIHRLPS